MEETKRLKINVSEERLNQTLKVKDMVKVSKGDLEAAVNIIANFVVDEAGEYIPHADAVEYIGELSLAQLGEATEGFLAAVEAVTDTGKK